MIDTPAFQARKARLGDATSKIGNGANPSLKTLTCVGWRRALKRRVALR